jgi:DNA-binding CsgD family transcriptional regulator/tetratricopeptide (TPR) repeat protein
MSVSSHKPIICPVLIGRKDSLASFHLLIDRAKSGTEQVALLCGEAGIGKSRLVTEIKTYAAAQDFRLFQGNCFPTDLSCPYAPLLDLLRSFFINSSRAAIEAFVGPFAHELAPLLPEIIQVFPDLATRPPLLLLDPEQEKRRLFAALSHFLLSQAAQQPLLLTVEDVHWSDDTSLEFLHYLARHCVTQPLLLLLTYRSDEIRSSLRHWLAQLDRERLAKEVALTRLTRSDTDAMLHAIFDVQRPTPAEALDAIYTLTEGNPFFIEEVLKSLIAADELLYANGRWDRKRLRELQIPRSIQDAVQQHTAHLSESARHVLLLAAVAGRRFDFALLQQVTHHDEQQLLTLMKELVAAQLVVEESAEQFAFRHALTQQAIYAQPLVRERKALHRIIAEAMERLYTTTLDTHLADLSSHFYEADIWEKALEYAQRAGEKAQSLYASRVAIEQYTRALDAAGHLVLAPPPTLYRARGQAYEILGEFEQAYRDYEQALAAAHETHDGIAEWQSFIDLGFLWTGRDYERAGMLFRQAVDLAQTLADPRLHAHSLNRLGNWHLNVEQPIEAVHCHQEALATFQRLNDPHGLAETLDLLSMASYQGCNLLQSAVYCQQAVTLFRALDNRQGLISSQVMLLQCYGMYSTMSLIWVKKGLTELLLEGESVLKLARDIGQRSAEAYVLFVLGQCLGPRGEYGRAWQCTQNSLTIAEEIEHRQWMTLAHWTLGMPYLDMLELILARRHFEHALTLAHEIGSLVMVGCASASLASVYIRSHDLTQAESLLMTAFDFTTTGPTLAQRVLRSAQVELALAKGKPGQALEIIDQLSASAASASNEQNSIPQLLKLRSEALLMLHQTAEAEFVLDVAKVGAKENGARPLLWRICVDLGKLYRAQRRNDEAELTFSIAQELIDELAATIPDTSLRNMFLQHATTQIPHSQPLSSHRSAQRAFGGLTKREAEVLCLLAQGLTSAQIAERLVIGVTTVNFHVRSIYSKLGVTSRSAATRYAVEHHLV